jgi:predicted transposase YdaD
MQNPSETDIQSMHSKITILNGRLEFERRWEESAEKRGEREGKEREREKAHQETVLDSYSLMTVDKFKLGMLSNANHFLICALEI